SASRRTRPPDNRQGGEHMRSIVRWFKVPKHRKYVYRVTTAGLVLAGGYGLIGPDEVDAWSAFLAIALVTALADAKTAPSIVPDAPLAVPHGHGTHRAD